MELFNYGNGAESTEKQTYEAIKDRIKISEAEFMNLPESERKEWVDSCRLALVLVENNEGQLREGYGFTEMYDDNNKFNLGAATEIVRNKKRLLDVIERSSDIDLTPAQFVLMGDVRTHEMANDVMRQINLDTAREISNVSDVATGDLAS